MNIPFLGGLLAIGKHHPKIRANGRSSWEILLLMLLTLLLSINFLFLQYNRSEYKTKDCSKNTKFGIVFQGNLVNLLEDR